MESLQKIKNKIEEMKVKYNLEREEDNSNHSDGFGMYWSGFFTCLKEISQFVDTLEVKEIDLENEVESYWKQCDMTWCRDAYSMTHIRSMLSDIAKHFYELGIVASNKTQKGEEV